MKNGKQKTSIKEIVLLIILFVLIAFYLVSKGPLEDKRAELVQEREDIQMQINMIEPKMEQMDMWQAELDSVYAKYGNNPKSIPDYNNINAVIAEMSIIFDAESDSTYSITFSDPQLNDHIVTRDIRISFSCYQYEEMISKLVAINESNNRYRIKDLAITEGNEESYSVNLSIVAYEYCEGESL